MAGRVPWLPTPYRAGLLWVACVAVGSVTARAQSVDQIRAAQQLYQWDVQCEARGCMLFLDVPHGFKEHEKRPNLADAHQYVGLSVGLDRRTRLPASLTLRLPPDADRPAGFRLAFASDEHRDGHWQMKLDPGAPAAVPFEGCDADGCVAHLAEGRWRDSRGTVVDLLARFRLSDFAVLTYTLKGKPVSTTIPLGPYKAAYARAEQQLVR